MSDAPAPYFMFDTERHLYGDIQGHDMTTQGIYMRLCVWAWERGGTLPFNIGKLSRMLNIEHAQLRSVIDALLKDDILIITDDGEIGADWMVKQAEECRAISAKRDEAGRRSGESRREARDE